MLSTYTSGVRSPRLVDLGFLELVHRTSDKFVKPPFL